MDLNLDLMWSSLRFYRWLPRGAMDLNLTRLAQTVAPEGWLPRGAMDLNLQHDKQHPDWLLLAPSWSHGSK